MSLKNWTWSFEPFSTSVVALAPTATSTGQADNPNFACGLDAERIDLATAVQRIPLLVPNSSE
jgi:hypothetical protein